MSNGFTLRFASEDMPTLGNEAFFRCGKLPCVDRVYLFSEKHLTQSLHYLWAVRQHRHVHLAADCLLDCLKIKSHEYSSSCTANWHPLASSQTCSKLGDRCCVVAVEIVPKYLSGCNAGSGCQAFVEADVFPFLFHLKRIVRVRESSKNCENEHLTFRIGLNE